MTPSVNWLSYFPRDGQNDAKMTIFSRTGSGFDKSTRPVLNFGLFIRGSRWGVQNNDFGTSGLRILKVTMRRYSTKYVSNEPWGVSLDQFTAKSGSTLSVFMLLIILLWLIAQVTRWYYFCHVVVKHSDVQSWCSHENVGYLQGMVKQTLNNYICTVVLKRSRLIFLLQILLQAIWRMVKLTPK
jgi:hypothetical protein